MLELVVIAPLVPLAVGDRFEPGGIPLHVTTLPKVQVPADRASQVESVIMDIAAAASPITVTAGAYAGFGEAGKVRVTTVERSADLQRLHHRLLDAVRSCGAVPVQVAYNGDGYRPHVTHTGDGQYVAQGEQVRLTSLALLDCTRSTRRICATALLSAS